MLKQGLKRRYVSSRDPDRGLLTKPRNHQKMMKKVENTRKYEKISARNKKLFIKDCNANEKINSTG